MPARCVKDTGTRVRGGSAGEVQKVRGNSAGRERRRRYAELARGRARRAAKRSGMCMCQRVQTVGVCRNAVAVRSTRTIPGGAQRIPSM